jgi:hypothetical protein
VVLNLNGLSPNDIGVELVVVSLLANGKQKFRYHREFERIEKLNGYTRFKIDAVPTQPGVFNCGIRIYPKNSQLPHRQDFNLLKWV